MNPIDKNIEMSLWSWEETHNYENSQTGDPDVGHGNTVEVMRRQVEVMPTIYSDDNASSNYFPELDSEPEPVSMPALAQIESDDELQKRGTNTRAISPPGAKADDSVDSDDIGNYQLIIEVVPRHKDDDYSDSFYRKMIQDVFIEYRNFVMSRKRNSGLRLYLNQSFSREKNNENDAGDFIDIDDNEIEEVRKEPDDLQQLSVNTKSTESGDPANVDVTHSFSLEDSAELNPDNFATNLEESDGRINSNDCEQTTPRQSLQKTMSPYSTGSQEYQLGKSVLSRNSCKGEVLLSDRNKINRLVYDDSFHFDINAHVKNEIRNSLTKPRNRDILRRDSDSSENDSVANYNLMIENVQRRNEDDEKDDFYMSLREEISELSKRFILGTCDPREVYPDCAPVRRIEKSYSTKGQIQTNTIAPENLDMVQFEDDVFDSETIPDEDLDFQQMLDEDDIKIEPERTNSIEDVEELSSENSEILNITHTERNKTPQNNISDSKADTKVQSKDFNTVEVNKDNPYVERIFKLKRKPLFFVTNPSPSKRVRSVSVQTDIVQNEEIILESVTTVRVQSPTKYIRVETTNKTEIKVIK